MKDKVTFFLPVRKGSQRIINKNTKEFAGVPGGLVEHKLRQLIRSKNIHQVILSTNDEQSIAISLDIDPTQGFIKVIERPESLCLSTTPLHELIKYASEITSDEHILWGHTTTPFVDARDYDQIISSYWQQLENGYDSLITVSELQNFIIDPKTAQIVNYPHVNGKWPRTQDLPMLYEVNHAVFLTARDIYINNSDRIGKKPYFYLLNKIKSFDIDWEEDFLIAEAIYEKLLKE